MAEEIRETQENEPIIVGDVVKKYIELRDSLQEWQKRVEAEERERKGELERLEVLLLGEADRQGVSSFKTPAGTAYKSLSEHYRIQDWAAFTAYVKKTDNFSLLQKRVTKTAAKEIHQETGEMPDGLDYFAEYKVNVRRPGK